MEIPAMSTVVIQAGAETTMKEPLSLNKCAAHAAEAKNKVKMIPATMVLEEMAKATLAEMKKKLGLTHGDPGDDARYSDLQRDLWALLLLKIWLV